jgi:predicted helicase
LRLAAQEEWTSRELERQYIGAWKSLSKQGLVEIDGDEQLPLKEDTSPIRWAVVCSRPIKDSKQATEPVLDAAGECPAKILGK